MGRHKKSTMDAALETAAKEKQPIDEMPLETMRDYRLYNEQARKMNKSLRIARYPIKQCPEELHPKERVIFAHKDQPSNPLKVLISDEKIHFQKTLIPGQTYDLPKYVVSWLAEKGTDVWGWGTNEKGEPETFIERTEPRFAIRTVYKDYD